MDCKKTGDGKYRVTYGNSQGLKTGLDIDLGLMDKNFDAIKKHLYENEELNTMKAIIIAQQEEIKGLKEEKPKAHPLDEMIWDLSRVGHGVPTVKSLKKLRYESIKWMGKKCMVDVNQIEAWMKEFGHEDWIV